MVSMRQVETIEWLKLKMFVEMIKREARIPPELEEETWDFHMCPLHQPVISVQNFKYNLNREQNRKIQCGFGIITYERTGTESITKRQLATVMHSRL